jgi:hypothetical protein
MGIGRDSANFVKNGVISLFFAISGIVLFCLILYFGYMFLGRNYLESDYFPLMVIGLFLGDAVFCTMLLKYIEEVLFKGK